MKKAHLLTLLGSALLLGSASQASAGTLSPTLLQRARAGDQTQVGVIVRFNVANTGQGRALFKNLRGQLNSQIAKLGPSAGFLRDALKTKKAKELWLDQSIYLPMTPVQARAVSQLPFVAEVFENFKVEIPKAVALSTTAAPAGTPWHLQNIGAPQAWAAGLKGAGIRIGHLDSGIDASHPELAGKIAAFQEFNGEGDRVSSQPHDTTDHGTHTAGLLVGDKVGVAPGAKVISALVLPNNEGTFAQVIAGMQYVLDPDNNADTDDGAKVVNMSLGIPGTWDEFIVPVDNMLKAGVVPVFAIGNFGPTAASTGSPGNLPQAIGVGALTQSGQVASYSSRGPVAWQGKINGVFTKPDISAPGDAITSAIPSGQYGAKSGSSQASPIVAGAVAVMLAAKPGLSVDAVKDALYTTASNAEAKNNNVGFGQISLPAALGKLGVNVTSAPAPTTTPTQPTPTQPTTQQPTGPDGYTFCAIQGTNCNFSGVKDVAFGTAGKYVFGTVAGAIGCTVAYFGSDPAPGLTKACYIKDSVTSTPAPTPTPTPTPTPAPTVQPTAPAGYTLCAVEGGTCTSVANRELAFGTAGKYVYGTNDASPTLLCTVAEWGGYNPAPGAVKGCFVKDLPATSTPATPPTTTTPPATTTPSGVKPTVLLVDDDMGQGADVTAALRDAIRANSASALVWNTQTMGQVSLAQLQRAQVVIWATGEQYQNTITPADQNTLQQYLAGGGKLLVTGQDIGYDIGQSSFYTGILKTRFVADSSGNPKFVTAGAFGNTAFNLNASGSAMNQYYPDVIADLSGSTTVASWGTANATAGTITAQSIQVNGRNDANRQRAAQKAQDPRGLVERLAAGVLNAALNQIFGGSTAAAPAPRIQAQSTSENAGAIVANDAGKYRTITMGFGMEGLTPNSRNLLMKTSLDWLMR